MQEPLREYEKASYLNYWTVEEESDILGFALRSWKFKTFQ